MFFINMISKKKAFYLCDKFYIYHYQGSQPTLKSGKIKGLSGNLIMDPFYWKISELSGNFDLISRKSGKINTLLEKFFSDINFMLILLFIMQICMFWNISRPFFAISIMLQSGFLCLRYDCSSATCDTWFLYDAHCNYMNFCPLEVAKLHY